MIIQRQLLSPKHIQDTSFRFLSELTALPPDEADRFCFSKDIGEGLLKAFAFGSE